MPCAQRLLCRARPADVTGSSHGGAGRKSAFGLLIHSGDVQIDQNRYTGGVMAVACPDTLVRLGARKDSHIMVIGGDPVGDRKIWWNFVSSSKDRIEKAKQDWRNSRFDSVPNDTEFIPLPEK